LVFFWRVSTKNQFIFSLQARENLPPTIGGQATHTKQILKEGFNHTDCGHKPTAYFRDSCHLNVARLENASVV
jgi:hypothetical protein